MVIICSASNPQACYEFIADIHLSMHHTNIPIRKGFETTVQIENIRQTAFIVDIDKVSDVRFSITSLIPFAFSFRKKFMQAKTRVSHFDFETVVNMLLLIRI